MCGWCFEGMALDILEKEIRGIFPSKDIREGCGFEPDFYLREASDFPTAFENLKRSMVRRRIVPLENLSSEIILFKAIEILVREGFQSAGYQRLMKQDLFRRIIIKGCGKELREKFIVEANEFDAEPFSILYDADTFLKEDCSRALGKIAAMLPPCNRLLGHYYSWWLKGNGLRKNDLGQLMEETGILDPLDDVTADQHERFGILLRSIYFSILVAGKYMASKKVMLKLAKTYPAGVPLFEGYDLWLQRVAALNLYDLIGFENFLKLLPELRATHFYYINLMRGFTAAEKGQIRDEHQKYPESTLNDAYLTIDDVLATQGPSKQT